MKVRRRGQTIIEVVIATTLISMGVIAALSLTNQSQKSSNYAKTLDAATAYNNQVADYLRIKKTVLGYATLAEKFVADSSGGVATYCLPSLPEGNDEFLEMPPGICDTGDLIDNTSFLRTLRVETVDLASGIIPATVTTTWPDTVERSAALDMEISQWK